MKRLQVYDEVPPEVAQACLPLTNDGSEMRHAFAKRARGEAVVDPHGLTVSVLTDGPNVIGWGSCSIWHQMWQVQGMVAQEFRRRGLGTALISVLLYDHPERAFPLAVFDKRCYQIAQSCGWIDVRLYTLTDGFWIPSKYKAK